MSTYELIANTIRHLDKNSADQPDLATLAEHAGLSPFHFHRLFSSWAGITPKDFLQCLTLTHVKNNYTLAKVFKYGSGFRFIRPGPFAMIYVFNWKRLHPANSNPAAQA